MNKPQGLASTLKARSDDLCKFLLVGIASNCTDLISDHESIARMIFPVEVPVMLDWELQEVVQQAEMYLRNKHLNVHFDGRALAKLVEIAGGFPWYIHLVGQSALQAAYSELQSSTNPIDLSVSRLRVELVHVGRALKEVLEGRLAGRYEQQYLNAVRNSQDREILLRILAERPEFDIPKSEVYASARELDVANPSKHRSELASGRYGRLIRRAAPGKYSIIRFSDAIFKMYVRLRPSYFENVDEIVRDGKRREADRAYRGSVKSH